MLDIFLKAVTGITSDIQTYQSCASSEILNYLTLQFQPVSFVLCPLYIMFVSDIVHVTFLPLHISR